MDGIRWMIMIIINIMMASDPQATRSLSLSHDGPGRRSDIMIMPVTQMMDQGLMD
jgi:hypothetical protein